MRIRSHLFLAHRILEHCESSGFSIADQTAAAEIAVTVLKASRVGFGHVALMLAPMAVEAEEAPTLCEPSPPHGTERIDSCPV